MSISLRQDELSQETDHPLTSDSEAAMGEMHASVNTAAFLAAASASAATVAWFRCRCSRHTPGLFAGAGGRSLTEYMSLPPSQYVNFGGVERIDALTFRASLPPISFGLGVTVQPVCLLAARRPDAPLSADLGAGCDLAAIAAEVRGSPAVEALNGAFVCSFSMRIRHLPGDDTSFGGDGCIGAECELDVGVQGALAAPHGAV